MSYSDTVNSSKSLFNPVKSIPNEFIFSNECDLNSLIFSFFKTFSTHIISHQSKIKFEPKIYDAKNDFNIATIYEKGKKLYIKSGNYENEFDDFYTKVNRYKEQKRKIRQSLKNGSLIYEVPLFKTINLNDLNEKVYEDTIFSREYKYDYISNVFYPLNDQRLDKDENIIFKLNQKSKFNHKGSLVVLDNTKIEDNEDKMDEDNEEMTDNNIENNINNFKNDVKDISKEDLAYFKNNEIMIEITKYDNFIQENISLFLLNLSNNQNNNDIKNNNINSIENILKTTENPYILDTINYFNNIFTPEIYNKFSFYKNVKINNKSQTLKEINSVLDLEEEEEGNKLKNNKLILDDENDTNLINDIKKYFDEETIKEINKDIEITQNFTHFYIEGNIFSKDNFKKIISFLNKENFYMFAWQYNKEQTKKFGIINNIMKVANLSNKVWFYINSKKSNDDIQ
jgi:hypothetical protein